MNAVAELVGEDERARPRGAGRAVDAGQELLVVEDRNSSL
jgi:hypothetical protein